VHGVALTYTRQGNPTLKVYTHYSASRATRIDRIYATQELLERKLSVETIVARFSDHLAVRLRISIDLPILRWERVLWKMDSAVITENTRKRGLEPCGDNYNGIKGTFLT